MQLTPQGFSAKARAEIMAAVRRGLEAGRRVAVTAREWGITEAMYYRWVREQARSSGGAGTQEATASATDEAAPGGTGLTAAGSGLAAGRRRGPFPANIRAQLQRRAVVLRDEGQLPVDIIAERLGVTSATVTRWLTRCSQAAGFVRVEVVEGELEPASAPASVVPVLLAPGGYRVEGLDVASLADLLRRLA